MSPEAAIEFAQNSHDPTLISLGWILAVVIIALGIAKPIMGMFRNYQTAKAEGSKDNAEEALYRQLKEQIEQNSRDILQLIKEKNHWQEQYLILHAKIQHLEECEKAVERMKAKLEEKDQEIRAHIKDNRDLMREIISLKERIHQLELRLAKDEMKFSQG